YPRYSNDVNDRGEMVANNISGAISVPADTQTYSYDAGGRLRTAFNRDAHVSRVYNPNGTLAYDTLAIRTYAAADFMTHVYGMHNTYDLDLNRIVLNHPLTVAGQSTDGTAHYDSSMYAYSTQTGLLASETDVMGNSFTFGYDNIDRLTSLNYYQAGNSSQYT